MNGSRALVLLTAIMAWTLPATSAAQGVLPDDYEVDEPEEEAEPEPEEADTPEETADEDEDEPEDEAPPKRERVQAKKAAKSKPKKKARNRRLSSGLGFRLTVGGLGTLRRMNFTGTDHRIVHRPGPYVGGVIHGTQLVFTLDESKSHLLIDAEGGFGSAKNANVEPALGRPLTTEHAYLVLLGVYERPIHPSVDLRIGLGISALSYTVEPNPDYTGHRYLSLATSFGAAYWLSEKTKLGGNLVFLPGLGTNQSAGDYGSARSFGGRGELYLSWRFLQPEPPDLFGSAELGARYSYTRFQTTMPETQVLGDLASTSDVAHSFTLLLSYNL